MLFLANENFPLPAINILRASGYDVKSVTENYAGINDEKVLEIASKENRVILTFDRDYGKLIFLYKQNNPPSVVFFRFKGYAPTDAGNMLIDLVQNQKIDVSESFTVIEETGIRQRKL